MNDAQRALQHDLIAESQRLSEEAELAQGMMRDGLTPQQRLDTALYFRQLCQEMRDLGGRLSALKAEILQYGS